MLEKIKKFSTIATPAVKSQIPPEEHKVQPTSPMPDMHRVHYKPVPISIRPISSTPSELYPWPIINDTDRMPFELEPLHHTLSKPSDTIRKGVYSDPNNDSDTKRPESFN